MILSWPTLFAIDLTNVYVRAGGFALVLPALPFLCPMVADVIFQGSANIWIGLFVGKHGHHRTLGGTEHHNEDTASAEERGDGPLQSCRAFAPGLRGRR